MSRNPDTILREFDKAARIAQRDLTKARNMAEHIASAKRLGKAPEVAQQIIAKLDHAQGTLQTATLVQWRQEQAPPPEARRQQAPGAPDDLVCKKCGEQRAPEDFFYDDGHGGFGYTKRCVHCRRSSRKGGELRAA